MYGASFSFNLPNGNYSANEIVSNLNSQFTTASLTCTASYEKTTNHFTFTAGSGVSITLNSSAFLPQFGFSVSQHSSTTTLESNQSVDLMPIKNIYIKINNLSIANFKNGKSSTIVAKVPVTEGRNGLINYLAHSNISTEIYDKKLDRLDIILCDDDENEIDFNGVPFSLSIGIVFDAKMEHTNPMRTNDEEFDMIEASV